MRASIISVTYYGLASWNSSGVSGRSSSGVAEPRGSLRPGAWTASISKSFLLSTSCWFWNWRDEKRLLRLHTSLSKLEFLVIDELGYVPLSRAGAELLFEVISQRYERGSAIVTSNRPFKKWTSVFGSERLTRALLDRLRHYVYILEMSGDSYRLAQAKLRSAQRPG